VVGIANKLRAVRQNNSASILGRIKRHFSPKIPAKLYGTHTLLLCKQLNFLTEIKRKASEAER
jgi:hypothetical protein